MSRKLKAVVLLVLISWSSVGYDKLKRKPNEAVATEICSNNIPSIVGGINKPKMIFRTTLPNEGAQGSVLEIYAADELPGKIIVTSDLFSTSPIRTCGGYVVDVK